MPFGSLNLSFISRKKAQLTDHGLHTLWCLIEGGLEKSQNLISGGVGINGGLENCLKFNRRGGGIEKASKECNFF